MKATKCFFSFLAVITIFSCSGEGKFTRAGLAGDSTILIQHLSGRTAVRARPKRVVILQYGLLDTYDALGLIGLVKGIPKMEVPGYLKGFESSEQFEDLGTTMDANIEKLHALEPDLIIIGSRMSPKFAQFSEIAPTINLEPDKKNYWRTFCDNQRAIGKLYNKEDEVEQHLKVLQKHIDTIRAKVRKNSRNALIIMANEGRLSVYGQGSRFGLIHDVLGLEPADSNITVSSHGQSVTNEYVKEVNPDMIFVIDRGAALKKAKATREQFANALIRQTTAYKDNKIIFLDPDLWYLSGGGLKSFQLMLDQLDGVL